MPTPMRRWWLSSQPNVTGVESAPDSQVGMAASQTCSPASLLAKGYVFVGLADEARRRAVAEAKGKDK